MWSTSKVGVLALFLWAGCGGPPPLTTGPRSEESAQESARRAFEAIVAGANQCSSVRECTAIYPGCPLACGVAVRADKKDEVLAKARALIDEYKGDGAGCFYDCLGFGSLVCEQNRCVLPARR
jgi:hypothetical protein